MGRRGTYLLITSALGLGAGCNAIFGLDEVEPQAGQGGAGGVAAGTGGSASQTGGGGTNAGGSAGATGGQGGTGGQPAVCDVTTVGTTAGCDPGQKCSIANVANGTPGCVPEGPRAAWSLCAVDSQCAAGTWCDLLNRVCKPVCTGSTCANAGPCIPAPDGTGGEVSNLSVCVADCEPVGATPCNQLAGAVTCGRGPNGNLDCFESDEAAENANCSLDRNCGPGLACWEGNNCYQWCAVGGNDCGGLTCQGFTPPVTSGDGNTVYGFCTII